MIIKNLATRFTKTNTTLVNFVHNTFWSRLFIFIVIFLVILALLSIWGSDFLEKIVDPIKFTKDTTVIVEIYPENSNDRTISKRDIVVNYLNNNKNVISFKVVPESELQSSLKNWNNILNNLKSFALPIIINVSLDETSRYRASDLQLALTQKVNNVYVQSEKNLASQLASSINISRYLILLMPIILFFIIFIVILFTVVGLVYTQRESISVLSFLGASYASVAKEFSFWVLRRSIKGCLLGTFVATIVVEVISILLNTGWFVLPSAGALWLMLISLLFIPIEATIITFFWVRKVIKWII